MFEKLASWIVGRKKLNEDVKAALDAPRLHGVNLDEWTYLGRSTISFTYYDSKHQDNANVFMFCKKDDTSTRKFVVVSGSNYMTEKFMTHPWIVETASLWQAGERDIYHPIHSEPSNWLKDYMLEQHKCVWSTEKKWWDTNDTAKYESARKTQAKKKPKEEPEILPVEDNIVKINFNKDEETKT